MGWAQNLIEEIQVNSLAGVGDTEAKARVARIEAVLKWALKSEAAPRLHAMVDLAQSEPGIPITHQALDANPWLLNVRNGTLNLRAAKLRPHHRDDLHTMQVPVTYEPKAACPIWHRFLWRIMGGPAPDEEGNDLVLSARHERAERLIAFLRRAVGYSLTGSVQAQVLLFLYGIGRNGKSTFLNTILTMMGEYGMQAISELLMVRAHEQHPTERSDLFRKRFVATVETEQGKRLAESLVKQLTGGEKIRARRMREDFWEFEPTHKLWLAANHKPVIRGQDLAIWRRIRLVPFTVTIPEEEIDETLPGKLNSELPGILAWAVKGCLEWQHMGLAEPQEVTDATSAYQAEMDSMGQFLLECCLVKRDRIDIKTKSSTLYDAYSRWSGEHISAKAFATRLLDLGYTKKMGGDGSMYWFEIGLNIEIKEEFPR